MGAGLLIALIGIALGALGVLSAKILSLRGTGEPEEPQREEVKRTQRAIVWMTLVCGSALTLLGLFIHFWA